MDLLTTSDAVPGERSELVPLIEPGKENIAKEYFINHTSKLPDSRTTK